MTRTLGDALGAARDRLATALDLPREVAALEAHVLLGHALQQPRVWLIAHRPDPLPDPQATTFDQLVARRLQGEPIAYITGEREFFGLQFVVTPDVLIPRPDTELLVELALALIPESEKSTLLDLGTGSGAIALSLAQHRPQAMVTAVDVSPAALAVARRNAERLGCSNVRLIESNWFDALGAQRFDLIVSNPPYIPERDPHLTQGDVRFEPRGALASGPMGMDAITHLATAAKSFLKECGHLLIEHGFDQGAAVRHVLQQTGYSAVDTHRDLAGNERVSQGRLRA